MLMDIYPVIGFNLGGPEILILILIILILFGAKRIPEMMKGLGQGVKEFKKAARDVSSDEDSASSAKPPATPPANSSKEDTNKQA